MRFSKDYRQQFDSKVTAYAVANGYKLRDMVWRGARDNLIVHYDPKKDEYHLARHALHTGEKLGIVKLA